MSEATRVSPSQLQEFIAAVFGKLGVPPDAAAVAAESMVFANLRGFDTHGLQCLGGYADALEHGRLNPAPKVAIERRTPWAARVDADNGLGHIAAQRAMASAIEAAETFGIGAAVVRRSNHFGAASSYSTRALAHDCIGIVTSNAMAAAAPFGALDQFLGTNPLSVAIPTRDAPPFVIDMATSEGSRKKVRQALAKGQPLPAGWALDKQGNPTTDPKAALEGVMLPFGGMKGSAITLLIDILSGVLSGAEFGGKVLSVATNQERESGNGNFMLVLKVSSFMAVDEFKARMDEELARMRALRPTGGVGEVIYPGVREHRVELERRAGGIPLAAGDIAEARSIGERVGITFPGFA